MLEVVNQLELFREAVESTDAMQLGIERDMRIMLNNTQSIILAQSKSQDALMEEQQRDYRIIVENQEAILHALRGTMIQLKIPYKMEKRPIPWANK